MDISAIGRLAGRNTIGDALRRAAMNFRDAAALHFAGRDWSFQALDHAADRVARRLLTLGLVKGDRVLAYGRNSDAYLLLWLGCARAGLVHVPVNYALTAAELEYVGTQSGAAALIHDPALAANAQIAARACKIARLGTFHADAELDILRIAQNQSGDGGLVGEDVSDSDVAQILYTSGTTGMPKGATHTHQALISQYASCIIAFEYKRTDRTLAALPLYHTAQMHAFTMPQILMGVEAWLIESPVPADSLELIERHGITSFFAPPTVWISFLRHPNFTTRDLRTLRNIYYGASIMPLPIIQELRQRLPGARPYQAYGQTEIAPLATVLTPEEHDARPTSVGRPVLNVMTRVVDTEMRDCPPGVHGEIVHRSPQLLREYWNKPAETAEAFAGSWFHSGDIGYMDEEGYLYIVDRVKDLINTGGVLVASREVEDALFTHPAIAEVAVIALPDPRWLEAVTAVVVLRPGQSVDEAALIAHARQTLAPFKLPKRVIFVETLPKNTSGKLLKRELRVLYAGQESAVMGGDGKTVALRPLRPAKSPS
ncbi:MAG: acyl-CoA synthetase [Acetobacteraceae bacterium]|nr:acyl-CoA synthetase [Acetobacteraceae bacterium]